MADKQGLKVLFVAGFGPIVKEQDASVKLYKEVLNLPLSAHADNPTYLHSEKVPGVKAFALWPLAQAAQSCFGTATWPADIPAPQAWLEFDVEDVASASATLQAEGYRLLVANRTEPWGQTVSRLLSPEGLLVGITHTPWMRAP